MCFAVLLIITFFLPPLDQRSNPSATLNTRVIFIFPLFFWFLFLDHVFHYFFSCFFFIVPMLVSFKTFVFIYFEFKCVKKNKKNICIYTFFLIQVLFSYHFVSIFTLFLHLFFSYIISQIYFSSKCYSY